MFLKGDWFYCNYSVIRPAENGYTWFVILLAVIWELWKLAEQLLSDSDLCYLDSSLLSKLPKFMGDDIFSLYDCYETTWLALVIG